MARTGQSSAWISAADAVQPSTTHELMMVRQSRYVAKQQRKIQKSYAAAGSSVRSIESSTCEGVAMTIDNTRGERESRARGGALAQAGLGVPGRPQAHPAHAKPSDAKTSYTKASDVMTSHLVSVRPDTPVKQVAKILLEHGISAAPVIDENDVLVGIVSEGDLILREDAEREARRDWWLALLAEEGDTLVIAGAENRDRAARDVMSAPVLTIPPDADLSEIAGLLTTYRIKRLPVVRDGHVLGIVSRADLLRVIALDPPISKHARPGKSLLDAALAALDDRFLHPHRSEPAPPYRSGSDHPAAPHDGPKVSDFQHAVTDFETNEVLQRQQARHAISEQQQRRVVELLDKHVTDGIWQGLLRRARDAAAKGQTEYQLLRFPSQLCSDGGRAINVPDPHWPESLRGEAAEIYVRWYSDLRPGGFRLAARILDFPDGLPGDVELLLIWGEETTTPGAP
jgi:CBS domain-containing protein